MSGGLEEVALTEIKAMLKGLSQIQVEKRQRRGRIHFRYTRSPLRLLDLTCVEGVFATLGMFGGVSSGRPGLLRIADAVAKVDLAPAVALYNILNGVPPTTGIAVNCTVGRGHRFSSGDLHQVVRVVLAEAYGLDEEEQRGPYTLQVQIEGKRGLVGLRLSERAPSTRRSSDLSLPTVCALGRLLQPERKEIWLEPFCRDVSIVSVLASQFGIRPVELVAQADRAVFAAAKLSQSVGLWDGQLLPIVEECVNGVFLNLRRIGRRFDLVMQQEIGRILARHGRVAILTTRDRDLESGIGQLFRCSDRRPLQVGGDSLSFYQMSMWR